MRVSRSFSFNTRPARVLAAATVFFLTLGPANSLAQEGKAARPTASKPPAIKPPATKQPAPPAPSAAIGSTHQVAKGDTLFRIATKYKHPRATLNQMVLGLYRANPDAFLGGNINQLVVGSTLTVPSVEPVTAVDPAQASQQLRELVARPLVPVPPPPAPPAKEVAPAKPRPEPPPKPQAPQPGALSPDQAAERYQEGLKLERSGDARAAMQAFVAAGDSGHAEAQKRLGDIYNTGNSVVARDYETALKWYQKARAQGIEIPKPIVKPGIRP